MMLWQTFLNIEEHRYDIKQEVIASKYMVGKETICTMDYQQQRVTCDELEAKILML